MSRDVVSSEKSTITFRKGHRLDDAIKTQATLPSRKRLFPGESGHNFKDEQRISDKRTKTEVAKGKVRFIVAAIAFAKSSPNEYYLLENLRKMLPLERFKLNNEA